MSGDKSRLNRAMKCHGRCKDCFTQNTDPQIYNLFQKSFMNPLRDVSIDDNGIGEVFKEETLDKAKDFCHSLFLILEDRKSL